MMTSLRRATSIISLFIMLIMLSNAYAGTSDQAKKDVNTAGWLEKSVVFIKAVDFSVKEGRINLAVEKGGRLIQVVNFNIGDYFQSVETSPAFIPLMVLLAVWIFLPLAGQLNKSVKKSLAGNPKTRHIT